MKKLLTFSSIDTHTTMIYDTRYDMMAMVTLWQLAGIGVRSTLSLDSSDISIFVYYRTGTNFTNDKTAQRVQVIIRVSKLDSLIETRNNVKRNQQCDGADTKNYLQ